MTLFYVRIKRLSFLAKFQGLNNKKWEHYYFDQITANLRDKGRVNFDDQILPLTNLEPISFPR